MALKSQITPPKTNMEPENGPLEKEIPIGNHVNFWGVYINHFPKYGWKQTKMINKSQNHHLGLVYWNIFLDILDNGTSFALVQDFFY